MCIISVHHHVGNLTSTEPAVFQKNAPCTSYNFGYKPIGQTHINDGELTTESQDDNHVDVSVDSVSNLQHDDGVGRRLGGMGSRVGRSPKHVDVSVEHTA